MPGPLADPDVRRVALVRLRVGLGDLLCGAPAVRRLRQVRPDVHVTLITWPRMAPVVARIEGTADEVLPFPGADGIPDGEHDPRGWEPFLAAARARRFDLALQVYGDRPAANRVTAALGARMVGGFAPTGWQHPAGEDHLYVPYPHDLHEADRHLRLFEHLGVPGGGAAALAFRIGPRDEDEHAATLQRHGLVPGRYAVLHPGASSPSRRWPVERYATVGDALASDGLRVVVTGVSSESAISRAVADAMAVPAVDLTGATSLGGLAALLRDAAVLIGNDTGTAHLAAAVGARSVTVFLPGDPVRWGHGGPLHRCLTPDVPCAPCPHLDCPIDFRCATSISPRAVLAEARALVSGVDGR